MNYQIIANFVENTAIYAIFKTKGLDVFISWLKACGLDGDNCA